MVLARCDREEGRETRDCQGPEVGRLTEATEKWLRLWNQTPGFEFRLCHLPAVCLCGSLCASVLSSAKWEL